MSHDAWTTLERLRERRPLVHNITNLVSMDVVANALLALGASPLMAHAEEEVADIAGLAHAFVANIGTLSPDWVAAMHVAASRMADQGRPWVLDPVGVGATPYRNAAAADLLRRRPTVVRANASEILALAGAAGTTRGVDSTHAADEAVEAAMAIARVHRCVVAVTGAVDRVTDGSRTLEIAGGHPLMGRVTALGCAASATIGAFLAVERDPVTAAAHALAVFGLAGEIAALPPAGPGTLRVRLMDALYGLDEATVRSRVRIS
jgi:hydroxyethylthiazole kinase